MYIQGTSAVKIGRRRKQSLEGRRCTAPARPAFPKRKRTSAGGQLAPSVCASGPCTPTPRFSPGPKTDASGAPLQNEWLRRFMLPAGKDRTYGAARVSVQMQLASIFVSTSRACTLGGLLCRCVAFRPSRVVRRVCTWMALAPLSPRPLDDDLPSVSVSLWRGCLRICRIYRHRTK